MIKISHRGNTKGRKIELENSPQYLLNAIDHGYDVEVDIWYVDKRFYFGHDKPTYVASQSVLSNIQKHAWFHCKNYESLNILLTNFPSYKFFWHQEDDFTLTSNGLIWTYPNKNHGDKSIIVDLDLTSSIDYDTIYGICSDYVGVL